MLTVPLDLQHTWAEVGGTAAAAPDLPFWPHLLKVLAVLTGLVGILLLVQYLWRRTVLSGNSRQPLILVLDTHYLAPKRSLVLIQVWRRQFLLAHTEDNLTLLAAQPAPPGEDPETALPPPPPPSGGPEREGS